MNLRIITLPNRIVSISLPKRQSYRPTDMAHLKAAGCRTIYIDGSFTTCKEKPGDFDACYDEETVDTYNLRSNARQLYNHYDRSGQKAKYRGEVFPSNQPVGNYGDSSYEFFQTDRLGNKKGIIAIDLIRWEYD